MFINLDTIRYKNISETSDGSRYLIECTPASFNLIGLKESGDVYSPGRADWSILLLEFISYRYSLYRTDVNSLLEHIIWVFYNIMRFICILAGEM